MGCTHLLCCMYWRALVTVSVMWVLCVGNGFRSCVLLSWGLQPIYCVAQWPLKKRLGTMFCSATNQNCAEKIVKDELKLHLLPVSMVVLRPCSVPGMWQDFRDAAEQTE